MGPQKIILFGGTFDPPHNGHMTLLAGAIEAVRPDLVLVEPAGTPPHKAGGQLAGGCHRLNMCRLAFEGDPVCRVSDIELRRGGKSYTIDTVRQMNARYPGAQLYFPMGSDMLLWFRNWAAYRELLRRVVLVAHLRTGEDAAPMREYAAGLGRGRHGAVCQSARVSRVLHRGARAGGKGQAVGRPCARKRGGVHCAAPSLYARGRGGLTRPAAGHLKRTLRPGRCGRESRRPDFDFRGRGETPCKEKSFPKAV